MTRRSILPAWSALLLSCAIVMEVTAQPPVRTPASDRTQARVMETFGVGANVLVRALAVESGSATLWVGTSAGVIEVDLATARPRKTFTRQNGLASEHVYAVGIDGAGNKWFGTKAGGVSRYRDGKWRTYFPMHGLADYWVRAFANGAEGDLWIGTWAGVSRYNPNTDKFRNYATELVSESVSSIAVDRSGRLWIGTEGGVSMFDGTDWKSWTHSDGLGAARPALARNDAASIAGSPPRHEFNVRAGGSETFMPNYVFAVFAAADGIVWAGTWGGGVSRYDGQGWRNYTTREGLAGNIVYSIAQDASGALWFGTNAGLSRYDGAGWRSYGRREGLTEQHIYALAVAPGGDVWAGTRHAVARIVAH
jgi:ligand-binding sensor domain-containing protein